MVAVIVDVILVVFLLSPINVNLTLSFGGVGGVVLGGLDGVQSQFLPNPTTVEVYLVVGLSWRCNKYHCVIIDIRGEKY